MIYQKNKIIKTIRKKIRIILLVRMTRNCFINIVVVDKKNQNFKDIVKSVWIS